jgi:hypothetical protein
MKQTLFLSILLTLLFACSGQEQDVKLTEYRFQTGSNSRFRVYTSKSDWANNRNAIINRRADANGDIAFTGLTFGAKYYFDRFTDDFSFNNWYRRNESDESNFTFVFAGGSGYSDRTPDIANLQSVLIDTVSQSVWKMIDLRSGNTSIWSTASPCQKDLSLIINKDFTLQYRRGKNTVSCTDTTTLNFNFVGVVNQIQYGGGSIPGLIDIIDEPVGNTTVKRLRVADDGLFNNRFAIFSKQ